MQPQTRSGRFTSSLSNMMAVAIPDILAGFSATTETSTRLGPKSNTELKGYEVIHCIFVQKSLFIRKNLGQDDVYVVFFHEHVLLHFTGHKRSC